MSYKLDPKSTACNFITSTSSLTDYSGDTYSN